MSRIFFSENDRLWVTDGSAAGTQQVSDAVIDNPHFFPVQGRLFMTAGNLRDSHTFYGLDNAVWVSDGSAGGTQQLADGLSQFGQGPRGGLNLYGIGSTATLNGTLYFSAAD